MTQVRIIGDVHGWWDAYRRVADYNLPSIQVGDFGVGFMRPESHDRMNEWMTGRHHPARFIRGNHDHPAMCQTLAGYIPDMTVEGDTMFIGGAWSIDHAHRTEGVDWWREEELSYAELDKAITLYEKVKPRVMITHDCPEEVSKKLFIDTGKALAFGGRALQTRTGQALQAMWEIHQPEYHFFGHWHETVSEKMNGTVFQCIGELDYIDVELNLGEKS